jgi:hypothetical protein
MARRRTQGIAPSAFCSNFSPGDFVKSFSSLRARAHPAGARRRRSRHSVPDESLFLDHHFLHDLHFSSKTVIPVNKR